MYYANIFTYYFITDGTKIFMEYAGHNLYKSKEEACKNAEREWLEISSDKDILTGKRTKAMIIWKDNENNTSNEEK